MFLICIADIDECNSNPCQGGECVNEAGGYRCDCDDGAVIGASGNVCYGKKICQIKRPIIFIFIELQRIVIFN